MTTYAGFTIRARRSGAVAIQGGDLIKFAADGTIVPAKPGTGTDESQGIAITGEFPDGSVSVQLPGPVFEFTAGGAVNAGQWLQVDTAGRVVPASLTQIGTTGVYQAKVLGFAVTQATAAGQRVLVCINRIRIIGTSATDNG